jgi:hypothetical protein
LFLEEKMPTVDEKYARLQAVLHDLESVLVV